MSEERIKEILVKGNDLLDKLAVESELDELQRAQIVQALIKVKQSVADNSQALSDPVQHQVDEFFERIDVEAVKVDFPKVQAALDRLSLGVDELISKAASGKQVVQE